MNILSVKQVAKIFQRSESHILYLIHSKKLEAFNVGGGEKRPNWRITDEAIENFIRRQSTQPPVKRRPRAKPYVCTRY